MTEASQSMEPTNVSEDSNMLNSMVYIHLLAITIILSLLIKILFWNSLYVHHGR